MYRLQYFTWDLYVYSSSELHSTSQRSTSNYQCHTDTESTRQRTQFTFTRETDENNADPFRQRTQFTSNRKANENKDSTAEKDVSIKCIDCNECH